MAKCGYVDAIPSGGSMTPPEPKSWSLLELFASLDGVKNEPAPRLRFPGNFKSVIENALVPLYEPLPVAKYTLPEASAAGPYPDIHTPPRKYDVPSLALLISTALPLGARVPVAYDSNQPCVVDVAKSQ